MNVVNAGRGIAQLAVCVVRGTKCYVGFEQPVYVGPGQNGNIGGQLPLREVQGIHDSLVAFTPDKPGVSIGGDEVAVFCLDQTGRRVYRFLYPYGVESWVPGEPEPAWLEPLLRDAPYLKPAT